GRHCGRRYTGNPHHHPDRQHQRLSRRRAERGRQSVPAAVPPDGRRAQQGRRGPPRRGSPAGRQPARRRQLPGRHPPALPGSQIRDHRPRRQVDHQRGRARRGLSQGEVRNRTERLGPADGKPFGDRARLPVGPPGPRPRARSQARAGGL
ncbi:MAG: hypothetical protein AVDCRST_MAG09-1474, partial [uncultured Sphingomonas sp.]